MNRSRNSKIGLDKRSRYIERTPRKTPLMTTVLCCTFCGVLFIGMLLCIALPDPISTEEDKRDITPFPQLTAETLFSGSFMTDYEKHFADTFPGYNGFMEVNKKVASLYYVGGANDTVVIQGGAMADLGEGETLLDYDEGKVDQNGNDVVSGSTATTTATTTATSTATTTATVPESTTTNTKPSPPTPPPPPELPGEGEVELVSEGEFIMTEDSAMETFYISKSKLASYGQLVERIQQALPETRVFNLFAPTRAEYYAPESYHTGSKSQKDAAALVYSELKKATPVDVWQTLNDHRGEYIYFRTDHHWTQRGAYYAYREYCKAAGFTPVEMSEFKNGRLENFVGSMYSFTKAYPQSENLKKNPDYVEYFIPSTECTAKVYEDANMKDGYKIKLINPDITDKTGNKYLTFISGDNPLTVIETSNKSGKKVLVTKESYGNAFVPFLVNHYETVYVVDPRSFNKDGKPSFNLPSFVKQESINDIVIINYSFAATNKAIINGLSNMID